MTKKTTAAKISSTKKVSSENKRKTRSKENEEILEKPAEAKKTKISEKNTKFVSPIMEKVLDIESTEKI